MIHAGIIGCGRVAPAHCEGYAASGLGQVRWACDCDLPAANALAAQFGIPRVTAAAAEVFADPEVAVVSICTDHRQHAELALAALDSGKHVLVEKPMALTEDDAAEMIRRAEERGVLLAGVSQHRWDWPVEVAARALAEGALGRILRLDGRIIARRTREYFTESYWRGLREHEGGSALMNQGYHMLDLMLYLNGPVGQVQAFADRIAYGDIIETEDTISALLRFGNGALGSLNITTAAPKESWLTGLEIVGTAGRALLDINFPSRLHVWDVPAYPLDRAGRPPDEPPPASITYYGVSHRAQIRDFVQAVVTGGRPRFEAETARCTLATVLRIYEAACRNGFTWAQVRR